jgi:hypothetical protein
MNDDPQLNALLRRWPDTEPASDFNAQVWRQIQVGTARRAVRPRFVDWLHDLLPRPALALPAAVVLGLVIGVGSGLFSVPTPAHTEQLSFLAPDTLAGALRR